MTKDVFKQKMTNYLYKLVNQWFDTSSPRDVMVNGLAKTIIKANINKYDGIIDLFSDENGQILVNDLIDNLGERLIGDGLHIDLTTIFPQFKAILPPKVLLYSKQDLSELKRYFGDI